MRRSLTKGFLQEGYPENRFAEKESLKVNNGDTKYQKRQAQGAFSGEDSFHKQ